MAIASPAILQQRAVLSLQEPDLFPVLGTDSPSIRRTKENLQRSWLFVNETLLGKRLNSCGEMGGSEMFVASSSKRCSRPPVLVMETSCVSAAFPV